MTLVGDFTEGSNLTATKIVSRCIGNDTVDLTLGDARQHRSPGKSYPYVGYGESGKSDMNEDLVPVSTFPFSKDCSG